MRGYVWGRTREDTEYTGILSIPDTVCVWVGMGTTWEDPKYPRILSIPDTVSGRGYHMYEGETRGDPDYPGKLSIPDTVCVWVSMGGKLSRIPNIARYLVFQTL